MWIRPLVLSNDLLLITFKYSCLHASSYGHVYASVYVCLCFVLKDTVEAVVTRTATTTTAIIVIFVVGFVAIAEWN